jgi:hypothetical protein
MNNGQRQIGINVPWSQTFRSYLNNNFNYHRLDSKGMEVRFQVRERNFSLIHRQCGHSSEDSVFPAILAFHAFLLPAPHNNVVLNRCAYHPFIVPYQILQLSG